MGAPWPWEIMPPAPVLTYPWTSRDTHPDQVYFFPGAASIHEPIGMDRWKPLLGYLVSFQIDGHRSLEPLFTYATPPDREKNATQM